MMEKRKESACSRLFTLLTLLSFILLLTANYLIFLITPNEKVMGPVQKIFYFHVGSALSCYLAFAISLFCSIAFLKTRKYRYDATNAAAGEVGFLFCSIVLISGMIWGHAAWNTWFHWEPRLVTFLILWLIFLGFNLLRAFGEPNSIGIQSSILGILGACTVPLVIFSIKLLPAVRQLHPEVVGKQGLDPVFIPPLVFSILGLTLLQVLLIWLRSRIELLTSEINIKRNS